jgi:hypothetical protein
MADDATRLQETVNHLHAALADVPFPARATELATRAGTVSVPVDPGGHGVSFARVIDELPEADYASREALVDTVRDEWIALKERFADA